MSLAIFQLALPHAKCSLDTVYLGHLLETIEDLQTDEV